MIINLVNHPDRMGSAVLTSAEKIAAKHRLKVVLTMLSLPGDRWKQLNGGRNDARQAAPQHTPVACSFS